MIKGRLTRYSLVLVCIAYLLAWSVGYHWRENIIEYDVSRYYAYLPAIFQYQDLSFSFLDDLPESSLKDIDIANNKTPDAEAYFNKMTMGLAYLYAPFYLLARVTAPVLAPDDHPFSNHYGTFVLLGGLMYAMLGLLLLSRLLSKYFKDGPVALTILSIAFGTNFFNYAVAEGGMSHAYSFFLFSLVITLWLNYFDKPKFYKAIILGGILGIIVLIRPTNALILIPLLLWKKSFGEVTSIVRNKPGYGFMHLASAALAAFIIILPQLIYWKLYTGSWIYYSYQNEGFDFLSSHLIDGVFSYRKGWLIYTPIMIFALAGFYSIYRLKQKNLLLFISIYFILNIYLVFSWKTWWYGGGFGARALVESYVFLAFPLSAFYEHLIKRHFKFAYAIIIMILVFSVLNLFQTYQYARGILHRDSMTKAVYWQIFGKTKTGQENCMILERPSKIMKTD